jgi:hypothetical protein
MDIEPPKGFFFMHKIKPGDGSAAKRDPAEYYYRRAKEGEIACPDCRLRVDGSCGVVDTEIKEGYTCDFPKLARISVSILSP